MSSEIPKTPAICSFGNLYATGTPPRFLNRGTKTMHGWRASTCESNVWIVVKAGDVYQWSGSCPRPLYILFCYSILFKSMFNSWFREIASDLAIVLFVNHKFTKITKTSEKNSGSTCSNIPTKGCKGFAIFMWIFACSQFKLLPVSSQIFMVRSTNLRSSRPKVYCKIVVLRNFAKFTGKHLCQSPFFKKETLAQVFFCEFCEISRNTFSYKHFWWLLRKPIDSGYPLENHKIWGSQNSILLKIFTWNFNQTFLSMEHFLLRFFDEPSLMGLAKVRLLLLPKDPWKWSFSFINFIKSNP